MASSPQILGIAGSTRQGSFNRKLLQAAADGATRAGADVTIVDLRELAMPLFDQDFEASNGMPDGAREFKRLLRQSQGLMIASPEYNSSVTAVLKNAIDWASRKAEPDEPELSSFSDKVAVLMSASPGALGGLRGLVHLRAILSNIRVLVLPDQKAVPAAHKVFSDDGSIEDAKLRQQVEALGERLTQVVAKLTAS